MSRTKLQFTHEHAGVPVTRDEFLHADFEPPWRYERAHGRLVVMTPAGYEHHRVAGWFRSHLGAYELAHPEVVEAVFQESWTIVDAGTDRMPDIAVYLHADHPQPQFPERVPELVFEIVSAAAEDRRRDYEDKRSDYRRLAVREYVIVDRFRHTVTVLRLHDGDYRESVLTAGDVYTSPLLPGLEIPLAKIL